jgi:hypothetical protein
MRLIEQATWALDAALHDAVAWPTNAEWKQELTSLKEADMPEWLVQRLVACAVDGTELSSGARTRVRWSA